MRVFFFTSVFFYIDYLIKPFYQKSFPLWHSIDQNPCLNILYPYNVLIAQINVQLYTYGQVL